MIVLQQMCIFFVLMGVGALARKTRVFDEAMLPRLSALIVKVCGPALIVSGALDAGERMGAEQVVHAFAVLGVLTLAMAAMALAIPRLLRYPARMHGLVNFGFWMTNIGYIGMPFVASVWGPRAMLYVTFYLIINNAMLYTYGIWLASKGAPDKAKFSVRTLANPGNLATVLTIVIYFAGIPVPDVLAEPVRLLGASTAPLAMMLVGAQLVDVSLKSFADVRLGLFIVVKMLAFPILILLALKPFAADPLLMGACLTVVGMPTGVLVGAFTQLYNPPLAPEASKLVGATTLVAVISIPLVSLVCGI